MSKVSEWRVHTSTEEAWNEMVLLCEGAQKSIDIEQYIFGSEGAIIEKLTSILLKKQADGVNVRLLLDAVGSFSFYRSKICKDLEESGIEIVFHKTTFPPSFKRLLPFFLRDHRKLIVVDNEITHISGVIIEERARSWRDTTVILEGSIVNDAVKLFEDAWIQAKRMKPVGRTVKGGTNKEFFFAGNSFRIRDKHLYRTIIRRIAEAKKTIYITTPYFALTRDLRRALWYAKDRGVEIVFIFPKRSDNILADCLARFYYARLLRRGIKIFHYTASILHAKSISIDGAWATVGSCNLDWLSIWINYELNIVSENVEFATEIESIFLEDLKTCDEVTSKMSGWYDFFGHS